MIVIPSLLLFLSLLTPLNQKQLQISEEHTIMQKYIEPSSDPYYIIMGSNQRIMASIFDTTTEFKGLILNQNIIQAQNTLHNYPQLQSLHTKLTNNLINVQDVNSQQLYKDTVLIMTMAELCRKYYLTTPKMLIMGEQQNAFEVLVSNNWLEKQCVPQIILIVKTNNLTDQSKSQQFLQTLSYSLKQHKNYWRVFTHNNVKSTSNVQTNHKHSTFNFKDNLKQLYSQLFKNEIYNEQQFFHPTKIFIQQMSGDMLSIEDVVRSSLFAIGTIRPIFVIDFNEKTDKLFINRQFTTKQWEMQSLKFKKIQFDYGQSIVQIYILIEGKTNDISVLNIIRCDGVTVNLAHEGVKNQQEEVKYCISKFNNFVEKDEENQTSSRLQKIKDLVKHKKQSIQKKQGQKQANTHKSAQSIKKAKLKKFNSLEQLTTFFGVIVTFIAAILILIKIKKCQQSSYQKSRNYRLHPTFNQMRAINTNQNYNQNSISLFQDQDEPS